MPEPSEEVDPYNDFMTTNIEEEYAKLTYKMLCLFESAVELFLQPIIM